MQTVRVKIEGITPLMMHRFPEEAFVAVQDGHRPVAGGAQRASPRDQAERFAYRDEKSGELFWPGPNLLAAIIAAGSFHKSGKRQLTTQTSSLVPAAVMVSELALPFGTKKFEVDSRRVVNPSTRGAMICHRPRLDKWALTFTLEIDETMFSVQLVRNLVEDAGKKIGLGAFRPAKRGPFGRFQIIEWKEG